MNAMHCAEQIQVPEEMGAVLKQFTKAAIRDSPSEHDVYKWAANYFAELSGQPLPFDNSGRLLSQGGKASRGSGRATTSGGEGGKMVSDVMEGANGFEAVDGAGGEFDAPSEELVRNIFNHYDTSGNGRLERSELPALIADLKASMGLDISDEQMHEFMNLLDADEDGTIDLNEFRQLFFQSDA